MRPDLLGGEGQEEGSERITNPGGFCPVRPELLFSLPEILDGGEMARGFFSPQGNFCTIYHIVCLIYAGG